MLGGHRTQDRCTGLGRTRLRGCCLLVCLLLGQTFFLFALAHCHQHDDQDDHHYCCGTGSYIDHCGILSASHGVGDVVPVQHGQDLGNAHRIEQVLVHIGGGGVDAQHRPGAVHQGAARVAAAHGSIRLNEPPACAALRQEAADAASGDGGVIRAERTDRLHGYIRCQWVSDSIDLIPQHAVLRRTQRQGDALIRRLLQFQQRDIFLCIILNQISLCLVVLVKKDMERAAALCPSSENKLLYHMAVGDDVFRVFTSFSYKKAGPPPVVHHAVLIRGACTDQDNTIEHILVKGGKGRHSQDQHKSRHKHTRREFAKTFHSHLSYLDYW